MKLPENEEIEQFVTELIRRCVEEMRRTGQECDPFAVYRQMQKEERRRVQLRADLN